MPPRIGTPRRPFAPRLFHGEGIAALRAVAVGCDRHPLDRIRAGLQRLERDRHALAIVRGDDRLRGLGRRAGGVDDDDRAERGLAYLRRLARVQMCFDLDSASSMSLNLRLTELQVISDGFLADALREIERSPAVEKFFAKHDCTWQNYFLYRCFHEVFPGAEPELYDLAFLDMCLDYFCLRSLCAILVSCDVELDEDVVSSLFSAWQCNGKASLGRDDHTDPLLIGFTLIGEVHD